MAGAPWRSFPHAGRVCPARLRLGANLRLLQPARPVLGRAHVRGLDLCDIFR